MATGSTPNYQIPYPLATDPVDVHGDVQDLAERVDTVLEAKANIAISNTFTQSNVFQVNSSTTAVRVTQTGSGNSFLVEDSANPDTSPFIINNLGNVGVGLLSPQTKFHVSGNVILNDIAELATTSGSLFVGENARTIAEDIGSSTQVVSFKSKNTDIATITTSGSHGFFPKQIVNVELAPADPAFDGEVEIIDVPTLTTFTYEKAGTNVSQISATGYVYGVPGLTNPIAFLSIDADDYSQVSFQNVSDSPNASTDFLAYADNGNDYYGWIDMGITSSNFSDPDFTITGPNDGYIFMSAPYGTTGAGNLVLATDATGTENKIIFAAGGLQSDNTQMEITPDVNVHVEIATPSTDNTTGAFTVVGGVGITGDTNTLGYVAVEGIIFGGDDAKGFNTAADLTNPRMVVRNTEATNQSSFSQIAFQNSDPTSSTDFIVYMDNGVDSEGWMDFGITGSEFDDTTYGITSPGDGYVFLETATDLVGPGYKGNLVLATGANGLENKIVFAAGGFASGDTQMEITPGVNVHIEIPTESVDPTTGALTVVGGTGIQGNLNVQGNVNIVGDLSFGGGSTTTETLGVTDPAIFVGVNNDADDFDLGLYIEYAPALPSSIVKSIDQKSLTSDIATLRTTTTHTFLAGDVVDITGVGAPFDGTNINIIDVPTTTTFTYAKVNANITTAAVSPVGTATVTNRRTYGGIVRDASDGVFKLFTGATTTPTTTVNFSEAGVVFGDLRLNSLDLTLALGTTEGGTGLTSFTSGGAVYATSTSALTTGTLPATSGGTGQSAYATGDIIYASATNTLAKLTAGTNGHLLTLASGVPTWAAAPISLPSQTGNAGELLTTDGTSAAWGNTVTANATTSVALIAKGLSSQTANLQEWQSNTGTVLFSITSGGAFANQVTANAGIDVVGGGNGLRSIAGASTVVPILARGAASQTAPLQQWQNSASSVLASMSANGNFVAVTKSFDIEHPTKKDMRLRYGSLEGPENGVYVRGTTSNTIIELPEYWTGLVYEDSITVNITAVGSAQNIYVEKIKDNKVYIGGDLRKAFFTIYGERKDVDKLIVEY